MHLKSLIVIGLCTIIIKAQTDNTKVEVTATIPVLVSQSTTELLQENNYSSISVSATITPSTRHLVLPDSTELTATSVAVNSTTATQSVTSNSVNPSTDIASSTSEAVHSTSPPPSVLVLSTESDIQVSTAIEPWVASSSNVILSSSATVYPTTSAVPDVIYKCGDECKSLKKKLYAASAFAILFLIVILVLGGLLYRQHKISRDYRDDPSLSRLI